MIRCSRLVVACAASLLVAACGGSEPSPTAPEMELRRSGGFVVGGNAVPTDSTSSPGTTSSTGELEGDTATDRRGGGFVVGGN